MTGDPAAALAAANRWMQVSTGIVAAGVVLEFFDLLLFSKEMTRVQRGMLFVATVMIIAGCGGEYWFERQASEAEAALERASDERIAGLARAEAADKKIATQAAEEAADLGVNLSTLSGFVEKTETKSTAQRAQLQHFVESERTDVLAAAATAKQDVADMALALNQERDLRARYAAMIVPRALNEAQYAAFVAALRPFPKTAVDFALTRDPEAGDLLVRMTDAVTAAGWAIQPWAGSGFGLKSSARPELPNLGEVTARGVQVQINESDRETLGPAALAIVNSLVTANIPSGAIAFSDKDASGKPDPQAVKAGVIHVIVGARN